jgi:YggT family protein
MMDQALRFLLDVAFGFMTYAFLLRFMMQWLRAPFRNPAGQAITALTDWAVKPMRRVVPGFKGQDTSTLLLAWLTQYLWLLATVLLVRRVVPDGAAVLVFALFALVELFKAAIWVLMVAVIVQAVLSWVGPEGPLAGFLNAMTFRFLAPIRRIVPPIGGTLDLSPLILIVILQLVLMVPIPWLESFVLGIAA